MARVLMGPLERALVVENPDQSLDELLAEAGMSVTRLSDAPDEKALIEAMRSTRAQVLFKRSRVPVTRALVEACPDLFAVQLCCIGDDSVDKQACADHGVLVFNDPVSNGRSVVEMVIAHLISLSGDSSRRTQTVGRVSGEDNTERYEIKGKTLGILGLGNIGHRRVQLRRSECAFASTTPGTPPLRWVWSSAEAASVSRAMAGWTM